MEKDGEFKQTAKTLLGLKGVLNDKSLLFMIDSGASNNFVSLNVVRHLGLHLVDVRKVKQVRLANGSMVDTCGVVQQLVQFGPLQLHVEFQVLSCDVPCILGMEFLSDVNPEINWLKRTMQVNVGKRKVTIQLQEFAKKQIGVIREVQTKRTSKTQIGVHTNMFQDLPVDTDPVMQQCVHPKCCADVQSERQQIQSAGGDPQVEKSQEKSNLRSEVQNVSLAKVVGVQNGRNKLLKDEKVVKQVVENCQKVGGVKQCYTTMVSQQLVNPEVKFAHVVCPDCNKPVLDDVDVVQQQSQNCVACGKLFMVPNGVVCNPLAKVLKKSGDMALCLSKLVEFEANSAQNQQQSVKNRAKSSRNNSENPEVVDLKTFVASGKRGEYLQCGVCVVGDLIQATEEQMLLNFTHRSAHGSNEDYSKHGQFQKVATQKLQSLQKQYPTVFAEPQFPIDRSGLNVNFEHKIPLKDEAAAPPKRKLYPLDNVELEELKAQLQLFLDTNRIVPSASPYGAPILFAKKKNGKLRMCIDYRMLNQQTVSDSFPLPRIDELLQRLDGACVFSKLDLRDGYHQINMNEADQKKTAFTCRYGTFEFKVMPFGLMSAPSTFQRVMNTVFFDLLDKGVLVYLDDVLIYSKTLEEHMQLLDKVFALLQKYKLFVKPEKCHLLLEEVEFLGHVVSSKGVSVEQGKIEAVKAWPTPTNLNQVQQFLGLCNYYRRFVCRFSEIASPLTRLTRKDTPFVWQNEQQKSFEVLKQCLCTAPVLKVFDPTLPTRVVCDASDFCIGSILEQQVGSAWHPVEYYSKRLNQAERNYSATDREFVAIRVSLERWRHFLLGIHFLILTDHAALTHLRSSGHVSRRNARWLDFLSQFDFTIEHVRGKHNVADHLSRIPGTEVLGEIELCSSLCTVGIVHKCDVGSDDAKGGEMHGVISVFDEPTLLPAIIKSQQLAFGDDVWLSKQRALANSGDNIVQFRNGVLCKLVGDHFCPIVPKSDSDLIGVILRDYHSSALGGHLGVKKLLQKVKKHFYWQNMFQEVDKFCKQCVVCQANKVSTRKPPGLLQPLEPPSKPFEQVTMDFVTHLPTTERDVDSIFTIVDRFSKLVCFVPMKSTYSAAEVAQLFLDHWVCKYGMPQKIVSDRDPKFTSLFWQSLMKLLRCKVALSSSYHPQTDGQSERFHRSIEQILRCIVCPTQDDWDLMLQQAAFALNSTIHAQTKFSPFKVLYGIDPMMPLDFAVSQLSDNKVVGVEQMISSRSNIQLQVQRHLTHATHAMATQANKGRREEPLAEGQMVWLKTDHLPTHLNRKLGAKWAGPYKIVKAINPVAFKLQLPPTVRLHPVVHQSQLKPHQGPVPQPGEAPVFAGSEAADDEFEVEAILGSRLRGNNETEFLVKWKGYSVQEATWEPQQHLENAQQLLQQFMQRTTGSVVTRRGSNVRTSLR